MKNYIERFNQTNKEVLTIIHTFNDTGDIVHLTIDGSSPITFRISVNNDSIVIKNTFTGDVKFLYKDGENTYLMRDYATDNDGLILAVRECLKQI